MTWLIAIIYTLYAGILSRRGGLEPLGITHYMRYTYNSVRTASLGGRRPSRELRYSFDIRPNPGSTGEPV